MITCKACIESLRDDPRVRTGRYLRCGCDYCEKPSYYRELEETQIEIEPELAPKELRDAFHKTQVLVNDLQNRMNKHIDASREEALYE